MKGLIVKLVTLIAVVVAVMAATMPDSMEKKLMRFSNFKSNPLSFENAGIARPVKSEVDVQSTTYTMGYLLMNTYSDPGCTDIISAYSYQLGKCYLSYAWGGTAYYNYNPNATDDGYTLTVYQSMYSGERCKSENPSYTYYNTFPSTCTYYYSNMYAKAEITSQLPPPPQTVGVMQRTFDPHTGSCYHAETSSWYKSGVCNYGWMTSCTGNGGMHSQVWQSYYNASDCTGEPYKTDYYLSSRSFCNETSASYDDDTYQIQTKYFCADPSMGGGGSN